MLVGFAVKVAVGAALAVTMTVAVAAGLVPPGPVQVSEYDVFAVRAPVLWLPLVASVPLQPPEAVHAVALAELHVSVEAPPVATLVGFAVNVAVGAALVVTMTVAVAAGLAPPGPVQVSEYVVSAVRAAVLWLPLVASGPLQPPDAVHAVALVELQVSVEAPPLPTLGGFADSVAMGTALTVTVTVAAGLVPPDPVQVSEYVVSAVSAPVLWLPLAASVPLQSPEALQDVALLELHVSVDSLPLVTAVGEALIDALGSELVRVLTASPQAANSSAAPITETRLKNRMASPNFCSSYVIAGTIAAKLTDDIRQCKRWGTSAHECCGPL
jgi:hypothetical protein